MKLELPLESEHLSGRYVDENGSPALLLSRIVGSAAIVSVYSWGFWPMPGQEAEFSETKSVIWFTSRGPLYHFSLYDRGRCDLEGETNHEELDDCDFPFNAQDAAETLGSFLNLTIFDLKVHTFDDEILDDVEEFKKVWKSCSKLKPVKFRFSNE